jgi:hypothetical protein
VKVCCGLVLVLVLVLVLMLLLAAAVKTIKMFKNDGETLVC